MNEESTAPQTAHAIGCAFVAAIEKDCLDEADGLLAQLSGLVKDTDDLLPFTVILAIQRGQVVEAYQRLNALGEDRCKDLKALCLNLMGDPTWQGLATEAMESTDPFVRRAMMNLCSMPVDESDSPDQVPDEAAAPRMDTTGFNMGIRA